MKGVQVLVGPPGTGKTTRIAEMVCQEWKTRGGYGNPAIVTSLTRAAASEAAGRDMPIRRNCVGTMHSFAYRSLESPEIAEPRAGEFSKEFARWQMDGKKASIDEPGFARETTSGGMKAYQRVQELRARQIPRDKGAWSAVRSFDKAWEAWKKKNGLLDFTDLIEHALATAPEHPMRPAVIFADEAQDLSALELALLRQWTVNGAEALCLVGDPLQALYQWRGAHPSMFEEVDKSRREILSQSYRVPVAVHRLACHWARRLLTRFDVSYQPREGDPGRVAFLDSSWRNPEGIVQWAEEKSQQGTVMIQSPCAYQLAPVLSVLRDRAIAYSNPWRRKRGDWNPLHRSAKLLALILPVTQEQRMWTAVELKSWIEPLASKSYLVRGAKSLADRMAEAQHKDEPVEFELLARIFQPDALDILYSSMDDPASLCAWWRRGLKSSVPESSVYAARTVESHGLQALTEEPLIHVGTIHSFKGAEDDSVLVIPDLSRAGWQEYQYGGDGTDGVIRLGYVALTRAKRELWVARQASQMAMPIL